MLYTLKITAQCNSANFFECVYYVSRCAIVGPGKGKGGTRERYVCFKVVPM